jgi:trehalose/maltose hydrolase-like predicted phosphorylase
VGTRVPAEGAGYADASVATETHVTGVYADKHDVEFGGTQPQGSVNLPGWTQLDVIVAGRRYEAAAASGYRQVLDLRRGVVHHDRDLVGGREARPVATVSARRTWSTRSPSVTRW